MIPVQKILRLQDSGTLAPDADRCECGTVTRSYYASTVDTDPNRTMYTNKKHFYNILHVAVMGSDLKMVRRALKAGADVHALYQIRRNCDRRGLTLGKIIIEYLDLNVPPKVVSDIIALIVEYGYSIDDDRWMVYPPEEDDLDYEVADSEEPTTMTSLREIITSTIGINSPDAHAHYMSEVVSFLKSDHGILI